jgi:hypothetical protein
LRRSSACGGRIHAHASSLQTSVSARVETPGAPSPPLRILTSVQGLRQGSVDLNRINGRGDTRCRDVDQSGGNPHCWERTPSRISRTHSPARQPLAGHSGLQKWSRPQGKQYALRQPEHQPKRVPSATPHPAQAFADLVSWFMGSLMPAPESRSQRPSPCPHVRSGMFRGAESRRGFRATQPGEGRVG